MGHNGTISQKWWEIFRTPNVLNYTQQKETTETTKITGGNTMKGYNTATGFMGYVDGRYMLFSSEDEYFQLFEEEDAA